MSHGDTKEFTCQVCLRGFRDNRSLNQHFTACHKFRVPGSHGNECDGSDDSSEYQCYVRTFNRHSDPKKPTVNTNENANLPCDTCGLQFRGPASLQSHQADAHNSLNVGCDICQRTFKKVEDLLQHKLANHDMHCVYCREDFNSPEELHRHKTDNHNTLYVGCDICQRTFKKVEDLLQHKLANHDMHCVYCREYFNSPEELHRHQADNHSKGTPCRQCDMIFNNWNGLQFHILDKHDSGPNVFCKVCGKTCRSLRGLKVHTAVKHMES